MPVQVIHTGTPSPLRRTPLPPSVEGILPMQLREALFSLGLHAPEELRLHAERIATVSVAGQDLSTDVVLHAADLKELLLRACGGSLYACRDTLNQGYLIMADGVRVGVSGTAAVEDGKVIGVRDVTGLIFRFPNFVKVDPSPILRILREHRFCGGVLIYSPPGIGKTTLLRAVTREVATFCRTVAVDTRGELAPTLVGRDLKLDVLVGYPRDVGLEIAVRCLAAQIAVCDEIGGRRDADAILSAANRGVPLIATAHADSLSGLLRRADMMELHRANVFCAYAGIARDPNGGFRYHITEHDAADRIDD